MCRRRDSNGGGREVILWADTFNNYFHPATSRAALDVLQAAGARVTVPRERLCCGRPLYDFGMLDRAKAYLQRVMDHLAPQIDAGVPIVVLEPSCASVFRDELRNLFPTDGARRQAAETDVPAQRVPRAARAGLPAAAPRAQRASPRPLPSQGADEDDRRGVVAEEDGREGDVARCRLLRHGRPVRLRRRASTTCRWRSANASCCPPCATPPSDTLIVSDGFSCREQIQQGTGRKALHLAEVHAACAQQRKPKNEKRIESRCPARAQAPQTQHSQTLTNFSASLRLCVETESMRAVPPSPRLWWTDPPFVLYSFLLFVLRFTATYASADTAAIIALM